jgi:hypothetical protein
MFRLAQHDTQRAKFLDSTREPLGRTKMKRILGIFELSKNEQRVVLIVMLALIAIAFVGYERRVRQHSGQAAAAGNVQPSPSPVEIEKKQ